MKKWNRIFAIALAAFAIAVMLPMGSVQALKEKPIMRLEPRMHSTVGKSADSKYFPFMNL